jgi:hypothetical protein
MQLVFIFCIGYESLTLPTHPLHQPHFRVSHLRLGGDARYVRMTNLIKIVSMQRIKTRFEQRIEEKTRQDRRGEDKRRGCWGGRDDPTISSGPVSWS